MSVYQLLRKVEANSKRKVFIRELNRLTAKTG
jgi:hypothetical protein